MAKKSFKQGIDAIFSSSTDDKEEKQSNESNFRQEQIRTSFILEKALFEKIKAVAFWERITITKLIKKSIHEYLDRQDEKEIEKAIHIYTKRD